MHIFATYLLVGGATLEDVRRRIKKAKGAFVQLYEVWRSKNIVVRDKIRFTQFIHQQMHIY